MKKAAFTPADLLVQARASLRKLHKATQDLVALQRDLPRPPAAEVEAMLSGERPLTLDVYLLGWLQFAILGLEEVALKPSSRQRRAAESVPAYQPLGERKPALRPSKRVNWMDDGEPTPLVGLGSLVSSSTISQILLPGAAVERRQ